MENIKILGIGMLFIASVIFGFVQIGKYTNNMMLKDLQEKNQSILDCQNRGNEIVWCLEKFNN